MKNLAFAVSAALVLLAISGCVSTKTLTPGAIQDDLKDLEHLKDCDFYLSKSITLRYSGDIRDTAIKGVVEAERILRSRKIIIAKTVVGALQTEDNAGEPVRGYSLNPGGDTVTLNILFGRDNENVITFSARLETLNDKFSLAQPVVKYRYIYGPQGAGSDYISGFDNEQQSYSIDFAGSEKPYLRYKIIERITEDNKARREPGRKPRAP